MKVITNYSREKLEEFFVTNNEKSFRAVQVFEWIYKKRINDFDLITNISKSSIAFLKEHFAFPVIELSKKEVSSDGTVKYLFKLNDGEYIETVLMRYNYGKSVCISTQVGCNMACAFCASGQKKKVRSLEVWEMVAQVLFIDDELRLMDKRLSHIVIMGIGEPFDNYDNVLDFIKIVNDGKGLDIGARHITVSTSGLVPQIYEFAQFPLQVNLAISLHFPNNELRSKYMPINRAYPIEKLMEALKVYYATTKRRLTFEYILMKDINDSVNHAYQLANLIKGFNAYINLIPLNEVGNNLFRSTKEQTNIFAQILTKQGLRVTIRREQGGDISAACGQLRSKSEDFNAGISRKSH